MKNAQVNNGFQTGNQEVTQGVVDQDYTFEKVPAKARKGFFAMFFIMLGFTFFSASMSVGAKLGIGLDLSGFLWSIIIGGIILSVYTGLLAYIGSKTGLSFDLLARKSFGQQGSKLASLFIGMTQIGWFGVGAAMFAVPAADLLHISPVVLIALAGVCMTTSAYFGIKGMEIISYISVPLIAGLGIYSMGLALSEQGASAMFAQSSGNLSIFAGTGMVIGSFISGGTATPNFARFAKNTKIATISTVVAFSIGNTLMFSFGAVGGAFTGRDDIFYVMIAQGLAVAALIVLGANIWTTNDNALYTGALGLSNITGVRKRPMVLVAGLVGTVSALWLYNNFIGWLSFLNATLPPVGGIIILDFFLHQDAYLDDQATQTERTINYGAVAGVIIGALVGNFVHVGVASLNAMFSAMVVYFAHDRLANRLKLQREDANAVPEYIYRK